MDLKLNGKTALVTGGSEGIGKGIARALAQEGVDVAICARRKEPLEATAAEIAKETKRKVVPITADLSKDAGQLREAAKAKDDKLTNDVLQRLNLKIRALRAEK